MAYRLCNESLLSLVWKNKKDMKMPMTMDNASVTNTEKKYKKDNDIIKPFCVLSYNLGMGGVNSCDKRASTYCRV